VDRLGLDAFEKLVGQIQSLYDELSVLSKKKPSDAVSEFKMGFVNLLLVESNELLGVGYAPFERFTEFDLDDVPQNSDVVFMLAQYLQCFEKLRADNVVMRGGSWYWAIAAEEEDGADDNGVVYVGTVTPKRLRG
jgi:hypothetical protein